MKSPHHLVVFCGAVLAVAMVGDPALGQPRRRRPATRQRPPRRRAARPRRPPAKSPYRRLAPGVVEDIYSDRKQDESFSVHDVVELLAVDNNFDWAKEATFRHDVWALDFKFKPVRMMRVDVPQGERQNAAEIDLVPGLFGDQSRQDDASGRTSRRHLPRSTFVDEPIRFIPVFSMEVHRRLDENSPEDVRSGRSMSIA